MSYLRKHIFLAIHELFSVFAQGKSKYQGMFEIQSPKTWQVQERIVSTKYSIQMENYLNREDTKIREILIFSEISENRFRIPQDNDPWTLVERSYLYLSFQYEIYCIRMIKYAGNL